MKKKSVVTVGFFDGVHIGHKRLIEKVITEGKNKNLETVLLTFDRPPQPVSGLLSIFEERLELLKNFSLDKIEIIHFDKNFSKISPENFFYDILIKKFNIGKMVVGYDFAFGKNRSGNISLLMSLCRKNKVELDVVEPIKVDNKIVSSSFIRELLIEGEIKKANKMLGRFYSLEGNIIKGKGIGTKIGFPTANVEVDKNKLLPIGIFSGFVLLENSVYKAVAYIGFNPTFIRDKKGLTTEVYLIDFSKNIYGKNIKFFFLKKIRDEKKFKDMSQLKNQIERDVEYVKKIYYN